MAAAVAAVGCAQPAQAGYDPQDRRDPFAPLVTSEGGLRMPRENSDLRKVERDASSAALILEGILYDPGGGSLAVIDGQVYEKGDRRRGIEVREITPSRVTVVKDGASHELRWPLAIPEKEEGS